MPRPVARRRLTRSTLAILLLALAAPATRPEAKPAIPTDRPSIVHALNRLTFGATQPDVDEVTRMGLAAWIDRQLDPARIDDGRLDARLAGLETLTLPSHVIAAEYERPARMERREAQRQASQTTPNAPMDGAPRAMPSAVQLKAREVLTELSEAKLLRAVYSARQLEEVLVDFWFNHFNVFAGKGQTRVFITEYEREAIRPHVLGRFRDLLEATAKSPAMLFYLDNWMSSAAPDAPTLAPARGPGRRRFGRLPAPRDPMARPAQAPQRQRRGLNENYARELLELHTLGVDGGYTQADIVDVARAFTGWTIARRAPLNGVPADPLDGGGFRFAPALHDAGEKRVLGHTIKAGGGESDGERVLDIVAAHPSTARFVATKLARRFVSDRPPQALIDRAAERFTQTKGDLREVVRTIVTSPEFFAADARATKVKTPLEFVASALRATGATVDSATALTRVLRDLGMPVYFCQPPTGYDDTADTWVSSGALVNRMNFAVDLAAGRLRGVSLPPLGADPAAMRDEATRTLLFGRASDTTIATMARASTAQQTLALAIGSPEFQRR
jgi:uncharacterized protein (DUF1800 family)